MSCAVFFGSKWREPTGVKLIDCGGVDAGLPDAEFVVPREGVPASEDARQPPEVVGPYLNPMGKRSVLVVVVADNSTKVRERVYQRYVKTLMGTANAQDFACSGLARELSSKLFCAWPSTSEYGLAF